MGKSTNLSVSLTYDPKTTIMEKMRESRTSMDIQIRDPGRRSDWDASLLDSGDHCVFHTAAWAKVLETAYRYKPRYFVASEGDRIGFLMPMMEVRSALTGRRGVSLPFTDQCPLFAPSGDIVPGALRMAIDEARARKWRYVEWRDDASVDPAAPPWESFYVHDIDLGRTEADLFAGLTESNRRCIKKAAREGVCVTHDRTPEALEEFCKLNLLTRQRHGIPPQPSSFFKGLQEFVIAKDYGIVASARIGQRTVASAVFLHFGKDVVFKYGASDTRYQHLRPNNLIMWETWAWYAGRGFASMSLGRTELDNEGLLRYKRTWGGRERLIGYRRYDVRKDAYVRKDPRDGSRLTRIFARVPVRLARIIGRLAYRHVG